MKMLNKRLKAIIRFRGTQNDPSKFRRVWFTKDAIYATDGYIAVRVRFPEPMDDMEGTRFLNPVFVKGTPSTDRVDLIEASEVDESIGALPDVDRMLKDNIERKEDVSYAVNPRFLKIVCDLFSAFDVNMHEAEDGPKSQYRFSATSNDGFEIDTIIAKARVR